MASSHRVNGEYTYDGMTMSELFHKDVLDKIRDSELQDGDVLIATYPKCGEHNECTVSHYSA